MKQKCARPECNNTFTVLTKRDKLKKYCSKKCNDIMIGRKRYPNTPTHCCNPECRKLLPKPKRKVGPRPKYCNDNCRARAKFLKIYSADPIEVTKETSFAGIGAMKLMIDPYWSSRLEA